MSTSSTHNRFKNAVTIIVCSLLIVGGASVGATYSAQASDTNVSSFITSNDGASKTFSPSTISEAVSGSGGSLGE